MVGEAIVMMVKYGIYQREVSSGFSIRQIRDRFEKLWSIPLEARAWWTNPHTSPIPQLASETDVFTQADTEIEFSRKDVKHRTKTDPEPVLVVEGDSGGTEPLEGGTVWTC